MTRLVDIVAACGGEVLAGGRRARIPGPGHSPQDRSVSLVETDDGRILIHCFSPGDDWREVAAALSAQGLLKQTPFAKTSAALKPLAVIAGARLERARRFWREGLPVSASIAQRYLAYRAVAPAISKAPALRFHPSMASLEDRLRRPALLAAILAPDGALQGIEVTLLAASGQSKAPLATPRRVIGKMMGGAIRLGQVEDVLLVGEGMESAASAGAAFSLPAWALLSAQNLARFAPPRQVRRLVVAIDNDAAGLAAWERLQQRLGGALAISCAPAPKGFNDWNDWARFNKSQNP